MIIQIPQKEDLNYRLANRDKQYFVDALKTMCIFHLEIKKSSIRSAYYLPFGNYKPHYDSYNLSFL